MVSLAYVTIIDLISTVIQALLSDGVNFLDLYDAFSDHMMSENYLKPMVASLMSAS